VLVSAIWAGSKSIDFLEVRARVDSCHVSYSCGCCGWMAVSERVLSVPGKSGVECVEQLDSLLHTPTHQR